MAARVGATQQWHCRCSHKGRCNISYCRWSSDNWKSDIYAYESDAGYEIHVASRRVIGDVPVVPDPRDAPQVEWMAALRAQHAFLDMARREPIDLPHAGEWFCEPDLDAFEARLLMLRELGYRMPDAVFAAIDEERNDA